MRHLKRHRNKVSVKGLGRYSSYLAGFSILFHGSMKKFNQLAKKNYLKFFSSIKTEVAINFFFWGGNFPPPPPSPKIGLALKGLTLSLTC